MPKFESELQLLNMLLVFNGGVKPNKDGKSSPVLIVAFFLCPLLLLLPFIYQNSFEDFNIQTFHSIPLPSFEIHGGLCYPGPAVSM